MSDSNIFLWVKACITGIGSGFTIAFGWLGWLVLAWVFCMALDWVTGSISAAKQGNWSSAVARDGIFHKGGMLVIVIIAGVTDGVLGLILVNLPSMEIAYTTAVLPVVLVWYIFTELGSIAENATEMGAPVPDVLTKLLAAAASASADE